MVRAVGRRHPDTDTSGLTTGFADITQPGLALALESRSWLEAWGEPVHLIHCAAAVEFDLDYSTLSNTNVVGTRHLIDLARSLADRGRLARVDHVSTAFIAGDRTDEVSEDDIDEGQRPRNDYERTKLEAELEVAAAREQGLPIAVFRPSIIVAGENEGQAVSLRNLGWILRVYAGGTIRTIVGRRDCPVDAVPVDFVADAIAYLTTRPEAAGGTYHLAAGAARQATLGELVDMTRGALSGGPVSFVDPAEVGSEGWDHGLPPELAALGAAFVPYFESNPSFSVAKAEGLLAPAAIVPPRVVDAFRPVLAAARRDHGAA